MWVGTFREATEKFGWGYETKEIVRPRTCVFIRAKPCWAASPLAAGNRNVQANVIGDADAIQPGLGETCVRTFPAPSFGRTDTGGQGLLAPHPCTWEIARFSPVNSKEGEKETPIDPMGLPVLRVRSPMRPIGSIGVSIRGRPWNDLVFHSPKRSRRKSDQSEFSCSEAATFFLNPL